MLVIASNEGKGHQLTHSVDCSRTEYCSSYCFAWDVHVTVYGQQYSKCLHDTDTTITLCNDACMHVYTLLITLQVDPELRPNKDERERLDTIINSHSLGDHLKMLVLLIYYKYYYSNVADYVI
jgi:predicted metal-dependent hydrolase